jgi:hypothetical protein
MSVGTAVLTTLFISSCLSSLRDFIAIATRIRDAEFDISFTCRFCAQPIWAEEGSIPTSSAGEHLS